MAPVNDVNGVPDGDSPNEQVLVQDVKEDGDEAVDEQQNFGSEGMNGGFLNANNFSGAGDFNQMQMMMAMQNGMGSNFGGFPMMGTCFFFFLIPLPYLLLPHLAY